MLSLKRKLSHRLPFSIHCAFAGRDCLHFTLSVVQKSFNKTGVINDPLGQTHSLASSEHCFRLKCVCFARVWKVDVRTYGRTDNVCENNENKTGVINDPLDQATVPAGSDCRWILKFCAGRTDVRTDNMCENSDHYRPGLWSASWINNMAVDRLSGSKTSVAYWPTRTFTAIDQKLFKTWPS